MKKTILIMTVLLCAAVFAAPAAAAEGGVSIDIYYEYSDADLKAAGEEMLGVPYVPGGNTKEGMDAAGLVRYVFRRVGVSLPAGVKELYGYRNLIGAPADKLRFGDLVFFAPKGKADAAPDHVGIYWGDGKMLHVGGGADAAEIADMAEGDWNKRLAGARRAPREADLAGGSADEPQAASGPEIDAGKLTKVGGGYVGVPYVWGGGGDPGFDSPGLIFAVFSEAGLDLPRRPLVKQYESPLLAEASTSRLQFGDILFFSVAEEGTPTHAGIYWDDGMMLHASESAGQVVIESINKKHWRESMVGARRYPNLKKKTAAPDAKGQAFDVKKLREAGENFMGVKFVWGAKSDEATDSSGLLYGVFGKLGVELPKGPIHEQYNSPQLVTAPDDDHRFGDILFFDTVGDGKLNHAGIYWGEDRLLHASASAGEVILTDISTPYWKKVYIGAKRVAPKEAPKTAPKSDQKKAPKKKE